MAEVTVNIDGISEGAVAAIGTAAAAFGDLAIAADSSAADIAASMADLTSVIDQLAAEIDILAASMDTLGASAATAGTEVAATGVAATATAEDMITLSGAIEVVGGAIESLLSGLGGLIAQAAMFVTVIAGWQILNDVSNWVQNLVQQMFQLDEQTQRVVNSWQYLFAQAPGGGKAAASNLAAWSYQESPKLPFTAVDLRSAVSTLGTIPGIGPGQIEQFLPVLADIASTLGASDFGGQGINLQQAAQAIVGAQFGLTRQLRYELHINPDELLKYGLVGKATATGLRITDQSTLIPAIERWAQARGLVGAAGAQETTTFWGAYSSFQDYIQNALQTIGGIDPSDPTKTRPGSMFGGLQNILVGINNMLGGAQAAGAGGTLGGIEGSVGNILGGGVSGGISLFQGILGGAGGAGAGSVLKDLLSTLKDFGEWLTSSNTQAEIKKIGEAIGQFLGENLRSAQRELPNFVNAVKDLAQSLGMLWAQVTPQERQMLKELGGDLVQVATFLTEWVAKSIEGFALFQGLINSSQQLFSNFFGGLAQKFREWGGDLIQMLIKGMQDHLPNVGNAAQDVGNMLHKYLGFSKPEAGPLSDADRWMPDFMSLLEQGIMRGLPGVARASQAAAGVIGVIGGHAMMGPAALGNAYATNYNSTTNYGGSSGTLNMYGVSNQQLTLAVEQVLAAHDQQGYLRFAQPGGFALFGVH